GPRRPLRAPFGRADVDGPALGGGAAGGHGADDVAVAGLVNAHSLLGRHIPPSLLPVPMGCALMVPAWVARPAPVFTAPMTLLSPLWLNVLFVMMLVCWLLNSVVSMPPSSRKSKMASRAWRSTTLLCRLASRSWK